MATHDTFKIFRFHGNNRGMSQQYRLILCCHELERETWGSGLIVSDFKRVGY